MGCNETAVVVRVQSDRAASELDAICLRLDADGRSRFGRRYDLAARPLPQTLTALAGGRSSFQAIVSGLHRGVEVVRARAQLKFKDGAIGHADLSLNECAAAPSSGTFLAAGSAPDSAERAVLGPAPEGDDLLALGGGQAARFGATATGLAPRVAGTPAVPGGATTQLLSVDLNGDCLTDVVVVTAGAPPVLWMRAADGSFTAAADALPVTTAQRGVAAGDVDGDGLADLVFVGGTGGGEAHVLINDGAAHFRELGGAFDSAPTDATQVALGDLDGDGHLDLVVAQGSAMPDLTRVYLNDAKGSGHFTFAAGALPPRKERATAVALADVDLDGTLDLVIAHADAPVRLYLNRGNAFLEDRSFGGLPDQIAANVPTLLLSDLNADCLPDLVIARAGAAPLVWLNAGGGKFVLGPPLDGAGAATGVVGDDVTGDGLPDLVLFGPAGLMLLVQK